MPRPAAALLTGIAGGAVVWATGLYTTLALLAPLPAPEGVALERPSASTPAETITLPAAAASAVGPLDRPGAVYAGVDLDTARPIASITKLVTALVVLEKAPLGFDDQGPTIALDAAAGSLDEQYLARNGSVAPAREGQRLTQRQIIDLMLVWSANNYADTLAVWAFGSIDAYVEAARAWIDRSGLDGLEVVDATGFSPSSAATPRALLDLARVAVANPVIADSAGLQRIEVPGVGAFENRNTALGYDGITGLKTGTTDEAGACLLFSGSAEVDGESVDVVGVVLDAEAHAAAARGARALLGSVVDDYRHVDLGVAGEPVARWRAPWGAEARLIVADDARALVWGAVSTQSFVPLPELEAGAALVEAPTMVVQLGDEQRRVPLRWSGTIDGPDLAWRLLRPLREWGILEGR